MAWTCPRCGRGFARAGQSHVCAPAMSIDAYFADRTPIDRAIFDAIAAHLRKQGPVVIEAVSVGILFKRGSTFAEMRPKRDRWAFSLMLARAVAHPRIVRTIHVSPTRIAHFVDLRAKRDVDRHVRDWISEAYAGADARYSR